MLLAVDIGGTKVVVAWVEPQGDRMVVRSTSRYASQDFPDLGALLKAAAASSGGRPTAVGIGVAGAVLGRQAQLTNLPWAIDADAVQAALGCPVALLNDLEAHAHGLGYVDGLVTLNAGKPRPGNRALIAAGTGLGEALLFFDGRRHLPSASEGGHTDFAPRNDDEIELLRFLLRRYKRVSYERVVSGRDGFRNLYDFLVHANRIQVPPAFSQKYREERDIGAPLFDELAAGQPFAREIFAWFVRIYGAEAGNLALKAMSVNGVYIAGGIAPKILPQLQSGAFMEAFATKGRFSPLLAEMPVHVVTDEHAALKGAAAAARDYLAT